MPILSPADYRTMPWKNGLGITHEIAALRDEEDLRSGGFTWRLSIAEVSASAPFSPFPGCDRIIVLLHGDGMLLHSGEHGSHRLEQPLSPYAFSGDWSTDGTLLGGPCRDFNVMVDRRRMKATVQVQRTGSQSQRIAVAGPTLALYAAEGDVHIDRDPSADPVAAAPEPFTIPVGHTLLWTCPSSHAQSASFLLSATPDAGAALLVWLTPRTAH